MQAQLPARVLQGPEPLRAQLLLAWRLRRALGRVRRQTPWQRWPDQRQPARAGTLQLAQVQALVRARVLVQALLVLLVALASAAVQVAAAVLLQATKSCNCSVIYPSDLKLRRGDKPSRPSSTVSLCDWGEMAKSTKLQLQRRRV